MLYLTINHRCALLGVFANYCSVIDSKPVLQDRTILICLHC